MERRSSSPALNAGSHLPREVVKVGSIDELVDLLWLELGPSPELDSDLSNAIEDAKCCRRDEVSPPRKENQ